MKRYIALLFIFSLIAQQSLIYSQSNYDIVLTKKRNAKRAFIVNISKKVNVYYKNSNDELQMQKGYLNIKDENSIYCDSTLFQIKDIVKIRAKTTKKTNKITGAILAGTGIAVETLGVIFLVLAKKETDSISFLIELIIGIFGVTLGVALLIVSIFVASANAEYFDLQNDWDLTIEPSS